MLMDSDEDDEVIAVLMGMAHRMCFADDKLTSVVPISFAHRHNGRRIKI